MDFYGQSASGSEYGKIAQWRSQSPKWTFTGRLRAGASESRLPHVQ
ncbi:hypothetical protein HMPREF1982_00999 [Clostridiales bacterium oral taxon 876 str. F0540]|nr:hypothetical protein HMPREF1982_00999 [Clostridiales bacterium oral taxon 876 str. F0540]